MRRGRKIVRFFQITLKKNLMKCRQEGIHIKLVTLSFGLIVLWPGRAASFAETTLLLSDHLKNALLNPALQNLDSVPSDSASCHRLGCSIDYVNLYRYEKKVERVIKHGEYI